MTRSVAVVGAGEIVRAAHIPAYTRLGLEIRGIFDRDSARAAEITKKAGIPAFHSLDALLNDDETLVVDVAVPPQEQPSILYQVFAAHKHALAQKPLATTLDEARNLVAAAEQAGVRLAVNQQMRWEPVISTSYRLLSAGQLGRARRASFALKRPMVVESLPKWVASTPRLQMLLNTIHFLDSARFLFGEPMIVSARTWKRSDFHTAGETGAALEVTFSGEFVVSILDDLVSPGDALVSDFQLVGNDAIVDASFGMWVDSTGRARRDSNHTAHGRG